MTPEEIKAKREEMLNGGVDDSILDVLEKCKSLEIAPVVVNKLNGKLTVFLLLKMH